MLRFLAQFWAKQKYIFSQHLEAATNELNAGLSLRLAGEKRGLIEKLNKDAGEIEAKIKSMDEMLDKGFWECENGHEIQSTHVAPGEDNICPECNKLAKYVSRSTMTGQEKYESDKERKDAEKIAADKRAQAATESEKIAESERTAKYFKGLAENNRRIAEKIKSL